MTYIATVTIHHDVITNGEKEDVNTPIGSGRPALIVNVGEPIPKGFPQNELNRLIDRGFAVPAPKKGEDVKELTKPLNATAEATAPQLPASTAVE